MKSCNKCSQIKQLSQFTKCKNSYHPTCKECRNKTKRELKITNPDKVKHYNNLASVRRKHKRLHDAEYKAKQSLYRRQYQSNKTKNDPLFKLKRALRCRIQTALLSKGYSGDRSLSKYLGCSIEELKRHLESKFQDGMTWENHSLYGWHIDHIIPLSSATTVEEMYKLCHYTNLQPLWAEDNLRKSDNL